MSILSVKACRSKYVISLQSKYVCPIGLQTLFVIQLLLACILDNYLLYPKIEQRYTNALFLYLLTWGSLPGRAYRFFAEKQASDTNAFLGTLCKDSFLGFVRTFNTPDA